MIIISFVPVMEQIQCSFSMHDLFLIKMLPCVLFKMLVRFDDQKDVSIMRME